jgi:hypothetical protein
MEVDGNKNREEVALLRWLARSLMGLADSAPRHAILVRLNLFLQWTRPGDPNFYNNIYLLTR